LARYSRIQGAGLALLVQGLFLWALLFATVRHSERVIERETILLFHPTPPAQPRTIDAREGAGVRPAPSRAAPAPFSPMPQSVPQSIPQADLRAFGRALLNCAPEKYANLGSEERKHCPKPGEGLAMNPPPDLLNGDHSHVKDNARWANALAHKQSPRLLPGGMLFPLATLGAILDGSIAERSSAFRDPEKWPVYDDAATSQSPHDGERGYDAWRKDPSRLVYQQPGLH
jgi:hypothetical protein